MHCIVAEKEKSHLEFLCRKNFSFQEKGGWRLERVRLVPCFYCILEKPRRRNFLQGSKKGWKKEADENLSQIPD